MGINTARTALPGSLRDLVVLSSRQPSQLIVFRARTVSSLCSTDSSRQPTKLQGRGPGVSRVRTLPVRPNVCFRHGRECGSYAIMRG